MLRMVNFASSQLHPNGWFYMRAFKILCECLNITVTAQKFLNSVRTQVKRPQRWTSLCNHNRRLFMFGFRSSNKHFKDQFFRLEVGPNDPFLLVDETGREYFPLCQTQNPRSKFTVDRRDLSADDQKDEDCIWSYEESGGLTKASTLIAKVDYPEGLIWIFK